MPVDGMIIACWLSMGIVVGLVCLTGLVWAVGKRPDRRMERSAGREAIVVGALGLRRVGAAAARQHHLRRARIPVLDVRGAADAVSLASATPRDEPRAKPSMRRFTAILMSGALASKVLGLRARSTRWRRCSAPRWWPMASAAPPRRCLFPVVFLQNESVPAIMIPMHREALKTGRSSARPRRSDDRDRPDGYRPDGGDSVCSASGGSNAIVGGFSPEGRNLTLRIRAHHGYGHAGLGDAECLAAGEIALGRTRLTNIRASLLNVSVLLGIGLLVLTGHVLALAWSFTVAFNGLAVWGYSRFGARRC